jgi:CubicO group peptidase (beta-lactamase class C family)
MFTGKRNMIITITILISIAALAITYRFYSAGQVIGWKVPSSDIDEEILLTLEQYNVPSLVACILKKNENGVWETAWENAYGYRKAFFPRTKANLDTIYPIGSITKTFLAAAIMQLKEKGLIDLDEDISRYLPFKLRNPGLDYSRTSTPIPPITPRMLLSHRSGLPSTDMNFFADHKSFSKMDFGVFKDIDDLKAYLSDKKTWEYVDPENPGKAYFYKPGDIYSYSNVGYLILGYALEDIINKNRAHLGFVQEHVTWKDYIREKILTPLGMENTRFSWSDYGWLHYNQAQGYLEKKHVYSFNPDYPASSDKNDNPPCYAPGIPIPKKILMPRKPPLRNPTLGFLYNCGGPAGEMKSNINELAYFMIAFLNDGMGYRRNVNGEIVVDKDGRPATVRILSPESVREMKFVDDPRLCSVSVNQFRKDNTGLASLIGYGLGWMNSERGGRYWNGPWFSKASGNLKVNWDPLLKAGLKRNERTLSNGDVSCGGLEVSGNEGDLPGYRSAMLRLSDDLAIIYFMNEFYSDEIRDESRIQPRRFRHYSSACDGAPELRKTDGAFPNDRVKVSELEYILIRKASGLFDNKR